MCTPARKWARAFASPSRWAKRGLSFSGRMSCQLMFQKIKNFFWFKFDNSAFLENNFSKNVFGFQIIWAFRRTFPGTLHTCRFTKGHKETATKAGRFIVCVVVSTEPFERPYYTCDVIWAFLYSYHVALASLYTYDVPRTSKKQGGMSIRRQLDTRVWASNGKVAAIHLQCNCGWWTGAGHARNPYLGRRHFGRGKI